MLRIVVKFFVVLAALASIGSGEVFAQQPAEQPPQPRIAFVAGTGAYQKTPLRAALNDAGLVAETLRSIGFDVSEGADLPQADIIRAIRDFVAKARSAGPDAIAVVYIAGYGAEFEGENYLFASDAKFARAADIPLEAVRLSDLLRPLAATPSRAKIVILDTSKPLPLTSDNKSLSRGLAVVEPSDNMLIAYAAAPGTLSPPDASGGGNYGPYATALAEMLRVPGIGLDAMMTRVRARVHQLTQGKQTPWHVAGSLTNFVIDKTAPEATSSSPPPPAPRLPTAQGRALRDLGVDEAYSVAIERDNLAGYSEFTQAFPASPYVKRVRAMTELRREALAWSRAAVRGTAESYWAYLQRYPNARHSFEAQRRLTALSQPIVPPQDFVSDFYADLPPPLADYVYDDDVVIYDIAAPEPPIILIEPAPVFFLNMPPPPFRGRGLLPLPIRGVGQNAGFLRPRFARPVNIQGRSGVANRAGQSAPVQNNAAPRQALPRPGIANTPALSRAERRARDIAAERAERSSRYGRRMGVRDMRASRSARYERYGRAPSRYERYERPSPRYDRYARPPSRYDRGPSRVAPRYDARQRYAPPPRYAPRFAQPPQRYATPPRFAAPPNYAPPPQRAMPHFAPPQQRFAPPPRMAAPPPQMAPRMAPPPRIAAPQAPPRMAAPPAPRAAPPPPRAAPGPRCKPGTKC